MSARQEYIVQVAGWVAGHWREAGERVSLTPEAARYERVESVRIAETAAAPEADPDTSAAKPRRKGGAA